MSTGESNTDQETLTAFRQQIDALDDKIIELLTERAGIVSRVGEFKRSVWPGQCPIRAGREAEMVRRVMRKFEGGAFPPVAAAAMWRILIGSSTCLESPLSLSVCAPEKDDSFCWLAREYFGPTLPVLRQPHVKRVIGDVMDGKASIGIVPPLSGTDGGDWWASLMPDSKNTPKIFAHIPFVYENAPGNGAPAALAIARIAPEATGDDVSFIVLDADHNVSQHRMQTAFAEAKLSARWLHTASPNAATRRHLIEIKGFVLPQDAPMKNFSATLGNSLLNVSFLGAYAVPVMLESSQPSAAYAAKLAQP